MSFHGGLIGVIISTLIFAKIKNINFFNITDIIACVAPIGIFLGRIANFINGELFGNFLIYRGQLFFLILIILLDILLKFMKQF